MKKVILLLLIFPVLSQCQQIKIKTEQKKDALVIITTKVKR